MKYCKDCQTEKPVEEFPKQPRNKDGRNTYCRKCHAKRVNKSPNQLANVRKAQLKKLYDTTPEYYDELFEKQKGVCAICLLPEQGKREYLCIDHDHKTGQIRGLLCHDCNIGIGKLKDSRDLLQSAIFYLDKAESILNQKINNLFSE